MSDKKTPGVLKTALHRIDRMASAALGPPPLKNMDGGKGNQTAAAASSSSNEKPTSGAGNITPAPAPSSKISWTYLGNEGGSSLSSGAKSNPQKRDREISGSATSPEHKKSDTRKSPTSAKAPQEEAEDDFDGEAPDLSDHELADYLQKMGITVSDPSTFKDAVASKQPRKDYPYLVYLQASKTRREKISFKEFETFMEFYEKYYILLPMEERSKVNLDWSDYHMGRGLLAACDQPTAQFIKELADHFTIGERVFKGWLKTEFGDRYTYQMWLPGPTWCKKSPSQAMTFIFRQVNVVFGEWKVTKYQKTPRKGAYIIFEADKKLASSIYYLTGLGHKKRNKAILDVGHGNAEIRFKLIKGGQDKKSDDPSTSQQEEVIMSKS